MSFCENCEHELNGEQFCPSCGKEAPIHEPEADTTVESAVNTVKTTNPTNVVELVKSKLGIIIAVLVVVVVIVGAFVLTARGPEDVAKQYMKAYVKGDAKRIVSLMPKKVVNYALEVYYGGDKDDIIDELKDELDTFAEEVENMDAKMSKVTYKIEDTDKMKKDIIKMYEEAFEDIDLDIKKGKIIEIELTIPDGDDEETKTRYISVVKIGRSWYLLGDI